MWYIEASSHCGLCACFNSHPLNWNQLLTKCLCVRAREPERERDRERACAIESIAIYRRPTSVFFSAVHFALYIWIWFFRFPFLQAQLFLHFDQSFYPIINLNPNCKIRKRINGYCFLLDWLHFCRRSNLIIIVLL